MQYLQKFDVILLTETRSAIWDDNVLPNHSVAFVPAGREGQAGEGLLVAVRRNIVYHVQDWGSDDCTLWVKVKFQTSPRPLLIGCIYIPPSGSPQLRVSDLSGRMTSLNAMCAAASCEGDVLLAGDFNARVAQLIDTDSAEYPVRGCTDLGVNAHGHQLIALCRQSGLLLCSGRVRGDDMAVPTFKARSRTQASRLDHVIVSKGVLANIKQSSVNTGRYDSDHHPIETILRVHVSVAASVQCTGRPISRVYWCRDARNDYAHALQTIASECLDASESAAMDGNVCAAFAALEKGMLQAAAASGMPARTARRHHGGSAHQPFYDLECQALKCGLRARIRQGAGREELRTLERHYHTVVRGKRRAHRVQQLKLLITEQHQDPRCFWKRLRSKHLRLPVQLSQVQRWDGYLHKLAGMELPNLAQLPDASYPQCSPDLAAVLNVPITLEEVSNGLQKLHNGRAQGPQGYPAELLRYALREQEADEAPPVHVLAPTLVTVLNVAFHSGQLPRSSNGSLITPVFKSGDHLDTSKYRPIAVTDPIARLYAGILNNRLLNFTENHGLRAASQAGFRPRFSTVHQLFTLQHFIDHRKAQKVPLFCCFLDLKGAYDRVSRPLLWIALQRLGIHGHMLGAVQSLYSGCDIAINVDGKTGQRLPSHTGVKQGCPLSPTLFGLFIDGLHRHLQATCPEAGLQLRNGTWVTDIEYADDSVLLSASPAGLQRLIDATAEFCALIAMVISTEKTKVMVFSAAFLGPLEWSCCGQPLQWVSEFKYLGIDFSATDGCHHTFARLHHNMWGAWALLQKQYGNLRCATSVGLLLRLYDVCVPPTASYGCEVWGLRKLPGGVVRTAREQLQKAHIKILRQIAGARTSVATAILLRELTARPLVHASWQRTMHFWNNLAESPPHSLHYQIALDDCWDAVVGGVHNWASAIMTGLRQLGYAFTIRVDRLDVIDLPRVLQLLETSQESLWENLDVCPRTCPPERSQYCTYLRWFARPPGLTRPGPLLRLPLSARCMRAFLRFRMGCHGLPKDIGRRTAVPRMQRVCQKCDLHEIGDEKHLIFTCPAVQHVRDRYAGLFSESVHTMLEFMWQDDLVGVAKFLMDCFDVISAAVEDDRTSNQP